MSSTNGQISIVIKTKSVVRNDFYFSVNLKCHTMESHKWQQPFYPLNNGEASLFVEEFRNGFKNLEKELFH